MDGVGDWRLIEPEEQEPAERKGPPAPVAETGSVSRPLVAAVAGLVLAAAALAIWATLPSGSARVDAGEDAPFAARAQAADPRQLLPVGDPSATGLLPDIAGPSAEPEIVVDVEGAVVAPGLHSLAAGSRLGDAIRAAGGYSSSVDILAAGQRLNLAEKLTDGQQIRIPVLGESTPATPGAPVGETTDTGAPAGLVDLNHANAEELDTLPGIGPVTAAKIIDARAQTPFATVDELQARGVVGASTFEKIRDLVTVTP